MKQNDFGKEQVELTRRGFIKTSAAGAVAAAATLSGLSTIGCGKSSTDRDHILVGFCNPSTGSLAAFGEPSPFIDNRALDAINKDGGIYIKSLDRKLPVKLKMLDSQSDSLKAADLSQRLILKEKVDLMIALHTPNMVNSVSANCERYEVPCIALDCPLEPWLAAGSYKWTHHAFWSLKSDLFPVCHGLWSKVETNKVVGLIANNDPDGISFGNTFKELLPGKGYKVVETEPFPYGTQDFTALINTWKKADVEILFGNVITPDFITCWRQCAQMGFKPKIAFVSRAILFPAAVEALGGDLAQGLTSELWWSPLHPFSSSLTGETSKDLCDVYTKETEKQWSQPIGFKHAAYEILADALTRAASLDKEDIRRALAATDLNTIVGPVKYNDENYSRTPLVGGQWVKGDEFPWKLNVIYNQEHPEISLTGDVKLVGRV